MSTGQIGAMRHRLVLEQPVDTPDGEGGASRTWSTVATVWAGLRPLGAEERVEHEVQEQRATHRVLIRWRDDVTAAQRFTLDARTFGILAVTDPDECRRYLQIDVEEMNR